jgi:hypothetical protein
VKHLEAFALIALSAGLIEFGCRRSTSVCKDGPPALRLEVHEADPVIAQAIRSLEVTISIEGSGAWLRTYDLPTPLSGGATSLAVGLDPFIEAPTEIEVQIRAFDAPSAGGHLVASAVQRSSIEPDACNKMTLELAAGSASAGDAGDLDAGTGLGDSSTDLDGEAGKDAEPVGADGGAPVTEDVLIVESRRVDWSRVGIPRGVPGRATCIALGQGATAYDINDALTSCTDGEVVLPPGVFYLDSSISFSGKSRVTLRGAGASRTMIYFNGAPTSCGSGTANVCIAGSDGATWSSGNSASWDDGYARGATAIKLSAAANLAVGSPLLLDQLDDAPGSGQSAGIYVCETEAAGCSDDPAGLSTGHRPSRAQAQIVTVTAIQGSGPMGRAAPFTVTIDPGLYMPNWRASQQPEAWWASNPLSASGVEDLSLGHGATLDETTGIGIVSCAGCWVKGVASMNATRTHVRIWASPRTVVRDSYLFLTKTASMGVGVECTGGSSDVLIENNIFHELAASVLATSACSGAVIGYNYEIHDQNVVQGAGASGSPMLPGIRLHAGGIDDVLIEGNVGDGLRSDLAHGSHHFVTAFRNRFTGRIATSSDIFAPISIKPFSRFFNLVGNVLGDGQMIYTSFGSEQSVAIYDFETAMILGGRVDDPETPATAMIWGNYDVATGASRWNAAEVPWQTTYFPNPVPAANVLPASLYLSRPPLWWSHAPWPAIGPDVTGGSNAVVRGHAFAIPSQYCYSTTLGGAADGSGGPLPFAARLCYP